MNNKRHVLIVPAWYPSPGHPHFGIFVREQARALQLFAPDLTVSVWNWCPALLSLSFKRPLELLRSIRRWRQRPAVGWRVDDTGLREYVRPLFEPPRPFPRETAAFLRVLREVIATVGADRGRPDLVHAHVGRVAGWACSEVCPELGIPWVLTEHMGPKMIADLAPHGALDRHWLQAYQSCAALVAVSSSHADVLRQYCGRQPVVIPNAVDEDFFCQPDQPPAPEAPFLAVTRFAPVKAIDVLLRSYAAAASTQGLPSLRIGGDGPLFDSLRRLAGTLVIGGRVTFLGRLSRGQVRDEMQRCAALVISSQSESFGVVAVEAMACGRPVLSTACGGPADIVTPSTGILVPGTEVKPLTDGLAAMARVWRQFDPATIRNHAIAGFSRPSVAAKLCQLYGHSAP